MPCVCGLCPVKFTVSDSHYVSQCESPNEAILMNQCGSIRRLGDYADLGQANMQLMVIKTYGYLKRHIKMFLIALNHIAIHMLLKVV